MAPNHKLIVLTLGACAGIATLLGCTETVTDRMEHEEPSHRPANYSAAIARLTELHAEIQGEVHRDAGELDAISEAHDIARWLPEIAADSDLPESPWVRIEASAKEMQQILAGAMEFAESERREMYLRDASRLRQLNEELREVSREYPHPKAP